MRSRPPQAQQRPRPRSPENCGNRKKVLADRLRAWLGNGRPVHRGPQQRGPPCHPPRLPIPRGWQFLPRDPDRLARVLARRQAGTLSRLGTCPRPMTFNPLPSPHPTRRLSRRATGRAERAASCRGSISRPCCRPPGSWRRLTRRPRLPGPPQLLPLSSSGRGSSDQTPSWRTIGCQGRPC